MPGLAFLLTKVVSVDYLIAYAVFTLFYIIVLSGIMSFIFLIKWAMWRGLFSSMCSMSRSSSFMTFSTAAASIRPTRPDSATR